MAERRTYIDTYQSHGPWGCTTHADMITQRQHVRGLKFLRRHPYAADVDAAAQCHEGDLLILTTDV